VEETVEQQEFNATCHSQVASLREIRLRFRLLWEQR